MNRRGNWKLSPAFDISYAYDPKGDWTSQHQMSVNGKRDSFERKELIALANVAGIKEAHADEMLDHTIMTISRWPEFAEKAGIEESLIVQIKNNHRINL